MIVWFSRLDAGQKVQLLINLASIGVLIIALCTIALSFYSNIRDKINQQAKNRSGLLADAEVKGITFTQEELVKLIEDYASNNFDSEVKILFSKREEGYAYSSKNSKTENGEYLTAYGGISDTGQEANSFLLSLPMFVDGQNVGQMYIEENKPYIRGLVFSSFSYLIPMMLISIGLVWLVSRKVQQRLAKPLVELTQSVNEVAQKKDYTRRVNFDEQNELGELGSAFNSLMEELSENERYRAEKELEIIELNGELEEKVYERTKELQTSLDNLKLTQQQLVEQEKMASLGELVAGVAHEINTPIGIGITAISYLDESLSKVRDQFKSGELKKSDFSNWLEAILESSKIIESNLTRAANLVKSFKSVAIDQASSEPRVFDLGEYVQDTLMSLQPKIKRHRHQIQVKIENEIQLYCDPSIFSQIITNLVMNSLNHAFSPGMVGNIIIESMVIDGELHLNYSDDGNGIEPSISKRLFDPFVTTKRGQGGSGLGTHIIYNLVTQALNGSISCHSAAGQGVRFEIVTSIAKLSPPEEFMAFKSSHFHR